MLASDFVRIINYDSFTAQVNFVTIVTYKPTDKQSEFYTSTAKIYRVNEILTET
jgi:hypothetical protein